MRRTGGAPRWAGNPWRITRTGSGGGLCRGTPDEPRPEGKRHGRLRPETGSASSDSRQPTADSRQAREAAGAAPAELPTALVAVAVAIACL